MKDFINSLPKTELHLHLEGSFEPELMFEIAKRNQRSIPYQSIADLKAAYQFNNLQEFLDIYYAGASVLLTSQDFFDLTWHYLLKAHQDHVVHVEVFFDPQTHTDRGVPFATVINGILSALHQAQKELNISHRLILSFLRHLDEASAFNTLEAAMPYKDHIAGVGLDSSELGNPPSKFKRVFAKAKAAGFRTVAHAGEEGPAPYIWEALNDLEVCRIDHGNNCLDDEALVAHLAAIKMPLTLCPLSNVALKVIDDLANYRIIEMMERGLLVTIHSDDPAYFGGYINQNFIALAAAKGLTKTQLAQLAKNSFIASWLPETEKQRWIAKIDTLLEAQT